MDFIATPVTIHLTNSHHSAIIPQGQQNEKQNNSVVGGTGLDHVFITNTSSCNL